MTSTINPNVPATFADLLSEPVRDNFLAAYNDINGIQAILAGLGNMSTQSQNNVTITGGSIAGSTLNTGSVANSALAVMPNSTVLGNISGIAASPVPLNSTQLTSLINVFTSGMNGLVPASGGGTTNFLRADGVFAPVGTGSVNSVSGTLDRITSTGGANPVIDIANTYVGQPSIVTVGTITSGTWSGAFGAVSGANLTNITPANISAGTATIDITGNSATVTTINGRITAGTNVSITGSGTAGSPYSISATGGTGTVTSVSVVTANGISGSVANSTTTPAITLTLGAITPTSVAASGTITGSNLSGTNTGDQTITLTGAVTGSGTGSFATTIATPGTLTVSTTNSTATAHTHAITSSSAPGAAASLLATDSSGIIGSTGTRIVKGWFTDLTVTNAISGSITGNAGTVSTISGLITQGTNITITGAGTSGSPYNISASGGSGSVTSVSVVSTNGFAGTVATSTTTPAITLTTTVTGVIKGNGTAISAATAGTDYVIPSGNVATATALQTARTIGNVSFDGTANIVPQTIQMVNDAADSTCFVMFGNSSGSVSQQPKTNTGLTYDATTNNLGATTFTGALSGNATTATSAAKWTTARNIAGNSVDGSANVAFANKFIVQGTTDAGLSGAQFLGALTTGLVKNTTTTGVLSIAVANTDYQSPIALTTTGTSGAATFVGNTLNIPQYSGGGGGSPGGSDTSIQYNISGAFVGDSLLTWDPSSFQFQVNSDNGSGNNSVFTNNPFNFSINQSDGSGDSSVFTQSVFGVVYTLSASSNTQTTNYTPYGAMITVQDSSNQGQINATSSSCTIQYQDIGGNITRYIQTPTEITISGPVLLNNTITSYNGVSTVARGIPSAVSVVNLTAQGAAITATTAYTTPAAGFYRISWAATVTRAATSSCALGGTTGFQIKYTNQSDSVVKTTNPTTATVSGVNATGTSVSGAITIYATSGSAIQYLMGYNSVGATSMQYDLNFIIEAL